MNNNKYLNYIEEKLSLVASRIKNRSPSNLLDLNIRAENLYQGFFNRLFNYELASPNIANSNAAGIDLVDHKHRIIIQVSSEVSKKKIENSMKKVPSVYEGYSFKFISVSKSAKHLRKQIFSSNPHNLPFDPKIDIFDVPMLVALMGGLNIDKLEEIYEYFEKMFENNNTKEEKPEPITLPCPHISGNQLIGRKKALKSLDNRILDNRRFTIIQGMGGLGKSLLCRAYFTETVKKRVYSSNLWIACNNGLDQGLLDPKLLGLLKIERDTAVYSSVISRLAKLRDCLIVLDNISNEDLDVLESLLQLPLDINNFVVISTTREKIYRFRGDTLALGFMSEEDSVELYKHYHSEARDDDTIVNIINLAGRHTLTVELLAKTAKSSFLSEQELLANLKENDFDLSDISAESIDIEKDGVNSYDLLSNSLVKVFDLSRLNREEKELLLLIGYLDNRPLSVKKLKEWFGLENFKLFHNLSRSGWISQIGETQFSMHQVVSSVLRFSHVLKDIQLTSNRVDGIVDAMSQDIETPTEWFKAINGSQFFSHIGSFAIHAQSNPLGQISILRRIQTLVKICQWYSNMIVHEATEHYVRKTLKFNEELLKKGFFPRIVFNYQAGLIGLLAESYKKQGRGKEAIPLIEQTVGIRKTFGPPEDLAICYTNLGQAYLDEHDIPRALDNLHKSLTLKKKCKEAGSKRIHFSRTFNSLGNAFSKARDIPNAKKYFDQCLATIETELDHNHAEYWIHKVQIALFYSIYVSRLKGKNLAKGAVRKITNLLHENHPYRNLVIEQCCKINSKPNK